MTGLDKARSGAGTTPLMMFSNRRVDRMLSADSTLRSLDQAPTPSDGTPPAVGALAENPRGPAIWGGRAGQSGNPREKTRLRTKHESWLGERPAPAIRDQCLLPISNG
jgi:hypothetical protein